MNTLTKQIRSYLPLIAFFIGGMAYAQQPSLQYFRTNDKDGLNVFETPKENDVEFEGMKMWVGGDFAMVFQGLSQSNDGVAAGAPEELNELSSNFNLPAANLNLDIQFQEGLRLHLRTYLSSQHHTETYVKGGYLQIDNLDFIKTGFLSGLMEVATLRFGMDEINYGDTHFRRSDNARSIYNPFVGNYIMDAFTTEPFAEITIQKSGIIGVLGMTNGRLNQVPTPGDDGRVIYGKIGYDNGRDADVRFRITGSFYNSSKESTRDYLFNGDRAGSRFYKLLTSASVDSDFTPRFNPNFASNTSFQINPFVKVGGLEVFGIVERSSNNTEDESGNSIGGSFTQLSGEAIYRFGSTENFYLGGRYNSVSGDKSDAAETSKLSRIDIGGGWFMTKNILTKVQYMKQTYSGDGWNGSVGQGAEFDGVMIEAVIAF
ncbi:MAG: hypothetical protein O2887_12170 [Bacteroidetes bacterium]|nr:hypothetical protein [Bacteroidota bacterium]MDA1121227.1 hypothetical protein [Bacteroidota bacterium]